MQSRILILDNLRSAHNVGTILRTADGAGWDIVYLCGSTPAPHLPGDPRPPYAQDRSAREIAKTALGAEQHLELHYAAEAVETASELREKGYQIIGLEQASDSISIEEFKPSERMALVVGNEVEGVAQKVLEQC